MPQAIGRKVNLVAFNEATYGVSAGLTTGEKLYVKSIGVTGNIAQIIDETLSGLRGLPQSIAGNKDVTGSVPVNTAPQSILKWLKHLLGLSATQYAVADRTTSTITGVEVLRAENTSATGAGTLAYTASGTTITWSENGDTAGSPVNIGAGGDFTVTSTSGKDVYIRVTAALLPVGNQSDTVTIGAGTTYEHVFTPQGTEAVGMTLEVDLGAEIATQNRWMHFKGVRPVKGSFKFGSSGFIEASFDVRGANFTNDAGAALDATPDDFGHQAFSMFSASIEVDGEVYALAQEVTIDLDNDGDDTNFVIGGGGVRGSLPFGFIKPSGNVNALFASAALLNKAIAGTPCALRLTAYNGTGVGTLGNERITFRVPDLKFEAKTPAIEGPKGVKLQLAYNGHRPNTGESRIEVAVRTTRAAAGI
jgi:hypothetical protein